jgi:translation initiation factor IF-3
MAALVRPERIRQITKCLLCLHAIDFPIFRRRIDSYLIYHSSLIAASFFLETSPTSLYVFPAGNMNHTWGFLSSSQALRQIFVVPFRTSRVGVLPFKPLRNSVQLRSFQQSHRLGLKEYRPPVLQSPRNYAIQAKFVQVVNEEGSLDPPTRLEDVIDSFDQSEFFVMQMRAGDEDSLPICKIFNKKAFSENEKAKAKLARVNHTPVKQMELNWAIDAHDFSHRQKQLTKFLEKDFKVEITLTTKKRKRGPTVDEIKHVMQGVLDTIKAAGARQTREMEGELGKQLKITAMKPKLLTEEEKQKQKQGGKKKNEGEKQNEEEQKKEGEKTDGEKEGDK